MAGTALLVSAPVGYLLRYVGRVKLLLPVSVLMTSLLLTLLLLDERRSRAPATYFVIGCTWSVCDCCAQICLAGARCYAMLLCLTFKLGTYYPCLRAMLNTAVNNHRRWSVSGRSSTTLEQSAWQRHVSQFVVGFPAAAETHAVPAVIPRHYHVTFLNCNTHSGPSSGIATQATLKIIAWLIMAALCNRAGYYIFALWFLSFFFFFISFSSPNLSGHRLDVYHTSTHGVALVRI